MRPNLPAARGSFSLTLRSAASLMAVACVMAVGSSVAIGATINGGNGKDDLSGTATNDVMSGGNGSDTLRGLGGHDMLDGGTASDTLYGGAGMDVLLGDLGPDALYGEADNDYAPNSDDAASGDAGNDMLVGSGAIDGGAGNDLLVATSTNTVNGGAGTDICYVRAANKATGCESVIVQTTSSAPPSVSQTSGPSENATLSTDSATLGFSTAGASKTYCMLETGAISDCSSGSVTYNGLANGDHAVAILAVAAGSAAPASIVRHFSVNASTSAPILTNIASPGADQLSITGMNLPSIDRLRISLADGGQIVIILPNARVTSAAGPMGLGQVYTVTDVNLGREIVTRVEALTGASTVVASINGSVTVATSIDLQMAISPSANTLTVHGMHLDNMDYLVLMHDGGVTSIDLNDPDVVVSETQIIITREALGGLHVTQIDAVLAVDGMEIMDSLIVNITIATSDLVPPVITVPGTITKEATSGAGAEASFTVTADDAVDGSVAVSCNHASGQFSLGSTLVTCSATDAAGNSSSASFEVIVDDTTAPALTVPNAVTLQTIDPAGIEAGFADLISSSDLVDGAVSAQCDPLSGSMFDVGTTLVTCTATDAAGNQARAEFYLSVQYQIANSILPTMAGDPVSVETEEGLAGWALNGAESGMTAYASAEGVTFTGVQYDVAYTVSSGRTKEAITVKQKFNGGHVWSWTLHTPAGITPELVDGQVNMGQVTIVPPVILDMGGNIIDQPAYELSGNQLSLTLNDEAYPAQYVIDPTAVYMPVMILRSDKLAAPHASYNSMVDAAVGPGAAAFTTTNATCTGSGVTCAKVGVVAGAATSATANNLTAPTVAMAKNGWLMDVVAPAGGTRALPKYAAISNFRMKNIVGSENLLSEVGSDPTRVPQITIEGRLFKVETDASGNIITGTLKPLGTIGSSTTNITGSYGGAFVWNRGGLTPLDLSSSSFADRTFTGSEKLLVLMNMQVKRSTGGTKSASAWTIAIETGSSTNSTSIGSHVRFSQQPFTALGALPGALTAPVLSATATLSNTTQTSTDIAWGLTGGESEATTCTLIRVDTSAQTAINPCTPAGTSLTGLTGGAYILRVTANNAAVGTASGVVSQDYSFQIAVPPSLAWGYLRDSQGNSVPDGATSSVGNGNFTYGFVNNGGPYGEFYCGLSTPSGSRDISNSDWTNCNPTALQNLAEGDYTIQITAWDIPGVVRSSIQRSFTVKRSPVATITTYDSNPTVSTSAYFQIGWGTGIYPDYSGAYTAECLVDGNPLDPAAAWRQCYDLTYDYVYTAPGAHTFSVRLTRAGVGQPGIATYSWTVAEQPLLAWVTTPSATASPQDPTFVFENQNPSAPYDTLSCYADGNPCAVVGTTISLTGLSEGNHDIALYASDSVTGGYSSLSYSFTVLKKPAPTAVSQRGAVSDDIYVLVDSHTIRVDNAQCRILPVEAAFRPCGNMYGGGNSGTNVTVQDYYYPVTPGVYTFETQLTNGAGTGTASISITVLAGPSLSWNGTPAAQTGSTASFGWTNNGGPYDSIECRLDGSLLASCTSPIALTGLVSGSHTLTVTARDIASGKSSTITHTFTATAAPIVTLFHNRPVSSTFSSGQFVWDVAPATPESITAAKCSLDGAAFTNCAPGLFQSDYSGLAAGSHNFKVYVTNAAGTSPTVSYNWTISLPVPVIQLISNPATDTTYVAYRVNSTVAYDPYTAECKVAPIDAAFRLCSANGSFPVSDSKALTGPGTYTITARVTNGAGTVTSAPVTYTVSAAPVLAFVGTPPATTGTTATFAYTNSGGAATSTTCFLDVAINITTSTGGCASPINLTGLSQAPHRITIKATNASGSSTIQHDWTAVAAPGLVMTHNRSNPSIEPTGTFTFDVLPASSSSITSAMCKIDLEPAFTACASLLHEEYTGLGAGSHTLQAYVTNAAGTSAVATATWTIQAPAPVIQMLSDPAVNLTYVSYRINSTVAYTSTTAECMIAPIDTAFRPCSSRFSFPASDSQNIPGPGTYTITARVSNNVATVTSAPVTVTIVANPDIQWVTPLPANGSGPSASLAYTSVGGPYTTVTCKLDGVDITAASGNCASPITLTGLAQASHTVDVKATNVNGVSDSLTHTWTSLVAPGIAITHSNNTSTMATDGVFNFDPAPTTMSSITSSQCQLLPIDPAFRPCDNLLSENYSSLAPGSYQLKVILTNGAGSSPTGSYSWTIVGTVSMSLSATMPGTFVHASIPNAGDGAIPSDARQSVGFMSGFAYYPASVDAVTVNWTNSGSPTTQSCTLYTTDTYGNTPVNPVTVSCPAANGANTKTFSGLAKGTYALVINISNGATSASSTARFAVIGSVSISTVASTSLISGDKYSLNVTANNAVRMFCVVDPDPDPTLMQGRNIPETCAPGAVDANNLSIGGHKIRVWAYGLAADGSGYTVIEQDRPFDIANASCEPLNMSGTMAFPFAGLAGVDLRGTAYSVNFNGCDVKFNYNELSNYVDPTSVRAMPEAGGGRFVVVNNSGSVVVMNDDGTGASLVHQIGPGYVTTRTIDNFYPYSHVIIFKNGDLFLPLVEAATGDTDLLHLTIDASNNVTASGLLENAVDSNGVELQMSGGSQVLISDDGTHLLTKSGATDTNNASTKWCYGPVDGSTPCQVLPESVQQDSHSIPALGELRGTTLYTIRTVSTEANTKLHNEVIKVDLTGVAPTQVLYSGFDMPQPGNANIDGIGSLSLSLDGTKLAWTARNDASYTLGTMTRLNLIVMNTTTDSYYIASHVSSLIDGGALSAGQAVVSESPLWLNNSTVLLERVKANNGETFVLMPITGSLAASSLFIIDGGFASTL